MTRRVIVIVIVIVTHTHARQTVAIRMALPAAERLASGTVESTGTHTGRNQPPRG